MRALESTLENAKTTRPSNTSLLLATAGFASALEKANTADVARAQEALTESKQEVKTNLKTVNDYPRGMEPPKKTKISAIAAEVSQKKKRDILWDAMPWGAVVGLVMAVVGSITMLSGVSLFYAHPMWERGDHTMSSFGTYTGLLFFVLLFDLLAVERCIALKYALHVPVSDHGRKVEADYPDWAPSAMTTSSKRGNGVGSVEGRHISLNMYEFSRFMTGRPTAAAGRAGSRCCKCYPYVMRVVARVVVLLSLFIIFPATLLTCIQFGFGFVCDHYTESRGMFEAIVTFANTEYSAGLTLDACEDPPWLDQSDPAHPVYVAINPHYTSGTLNIVGVFVLLAAQLLILFVYSPLDTIYSYATDKKVANLVFLDDFVRVPDQEVVGGSEIALL
jgi:hypothetical protein